MASPGDGIFTPLDSTPSTLTAWLARYEARAGRVAKRYDDISRRIAAVRFWVALAGAVGVFLAYRAGGWPMAGWVALGVLIPFAIIARRHRFVDEARDRMLRWQQIKRTHRARLERTWTALPEPQVLSAEPAHPFGADLRLFGPASLHRLLDTAATLQGSRRLQDWLLAETPDLKVISRRQQIAAELKRRGLFRDRVTLLGSPEGKPFDASALTAWLSERPPAQPLGGWIIALAVLGLVNLGLLVAGSPLFTYGLIVYFVLTMRHFKRISAGFFEALDLEKALERISAVAGYLERFGYAEAPALAALCAPFREASERPSAHLRRVRRLTSALALKQNPVVAVLLNLFFPWELYFTRRLDLVRDGLAERMPLWLSVWYDLEALSSLATYAALHPWTVQPEFASGDEPAFRAESVGHPLLPASESVRNTFELEHVGDAALITGSNMSGKSTFLRALGLNLCLAQAGSYVDAHVLRTRPVRVFTSLNVSDSVTDGLSFFYAEVRRLRALLDQLDASRPTPLFYLIDEIFRGTNNIERLVGSQSILEALVGAPGLGCVTTHDLDLVRLADTLPQLENYHFREHIEAGTMTFDYTLRSGPSPTTNALEIMRIEGLPVRDASPEDAGNP